MHSVTFRLLDANRITTEWRFYENREGEDSRDGTIRSGTI